MKNTASHDERIANITFAAIYPMYVTKVERKGRTVAELHEVIKWLTGFDAKALRKLAADKVTFAEFFRRANLNEHAHLITGTICGYRVEDIENPLTQKVRYLDKVIDELAQGRAMEKILRNPEMAAKPKATTKATTRTRPAPKPKPKPAKAKPVKKAAPGKTTAKSKPAKRKASA